MSQASPKTKKTNITVNPWHEIPSLGNLDAYISAVNQLPFLTAQEEQKFAYQLTSQQDLEAASKLVLSHLRFVVAIARQYLGYGIPLADLIQEGNIGLMKAVKRYNPDQGVRLVSYAVHWVKAEIHEFIIKNWRIVKIATSKPQRKLFFNLRQLKHDIKVNSNDQARNSLSEEEINTIAEQLKVRPEDVKEMNTRLGANDVSLEPSPNNNDEDDFTPIIYLTDNNNEPSRIIEQKQRHAMATTGIQEALQILDSRSRRIIEERWLKVNEDGSGGMTLHELANEYQISAERIRQIETAAMKKIKKFLQN